MDGLDRPFHLLCERRAIPTGISNCLKYMGFVAIDGRFARSRGVTDVSGFPRSSHRIARKHEYTFNFKCLN
jgi:hypothetical protein